MAEKDDVGDAITDAESETCESLDRKIQALRDALGQVQDPTYRAEITALIIQLQRRKRALGCP